MIPLPIPLSLSERHNSSSFDYIQLTIPPALSDTHVRVLQTQFDFNYCARTQGRLKEKGKLAALFSFHRVHFELFSLNFFNSFRRCVALPFDFERCRPSKVICQFTEATAWNLGRIKPAFFVFLLLGVCVCDAQRLL